MRWVMHLQPKTSTCISISGRASTKVIRTLSHIQYIFRIRSPRERRHRRPARVETAISEGLVAVHRWNTLCAFPGQPAIGWKGGFELLGTVRPCPISILPHSGELPAGPGTKLPLLAFWPLIGSPRSYLEHRGALSCRILIDSPVGFDREFRDDRNSNHTIPYRGFSNLVIVPTLRFLRVVTRIIAASPSQARSDSSL